MSLRFQPLKPIPPQTIEVAKAALGKNNVIIKLRDELGTFYQDSDFAQVYSPEGQPGICPWRLAMVCVLQYLDNLSEDLGTSILSRRGKTSLARSGKFTAGRDSF